MMDWIHKVLLNVTASFISKYNNFIIKLSAITYCKVRLSVLESTTDRSIYRNIDLMNTVNKMPEYVSCELILVEYF